MISDTDLKISAEVFEVKSFSVLSCSLLHDLFYTQKMIYNYARGLLLGLTRRTLWNI